MVDISSLNWLQEKFFDIYCLISDSAGISPFLAIPTTVFVGRILLFPLYVRMRRKMPKFMLTNNKLQVINKEHMVKMQKGKLRRKMKLCTTILCYCICNFLVPRVTYEFLDVQIQKYGFSYRTVGRGSTFFLKKKCSFFNRNDRRRSP